MESAEKRNVTSFVELADKGAKSYLILLKCSSRQQKELKSMEAVISVVINQRYSLVQGSKEL